MKKLPSYLQFLQVVFTFLPENTDVVDETYIKYIFISFFALNVIILFFNADVELEEAIRRSLEEM